MGTASLASKVGRGPLDIIFDRGQAFLGQGFSEKNPQKHCMKFYLTTYCFIVGIQAVQENGRESPKQQCIYSETCE